MRLNSNEFTATMFVVAYLLFFLLHTVPIFVFSLFPIEYKPNSFCCHKYFNPKVFYEVEPNKIYDLSEYMSLEYKKSISAGIKQSAQITKFYNFNLILAELDNKPLFIRGTLNQKDSLYTGVFLRLPDKEYRWLLKDANALGIDTSSIKPYYLETKPYEYRDTLFDIPPTTLLIIGVLALTYLIYSILYAPSISKAFKHSSLIILATILYIILIDSILGKHSFAGVLVPIVAIPILAVVLSKIGKNKKE
ncbi:MAG: hypothetical protein ACLFOC_07250 [Campylobacterales bacterium]